MQEVEDFIDDLPHDEKLIVKRLRTLILDAEPRIAERLSYGVPYFSRHRRLFFLWPASQPGLGKHRNRSLPKVTMGFCYGNMLADTQNLLIADGRKQVYTIGFSSVTDINEKQLCEIIAEAILADEQLFRKQNQ